MVKWSLNFNIPWLDLHVNNFRVNLKIFLFIYGALILLCFFFFWYYFKTTEVYDEWYANKSHYAEDYVFPNYITTINDVESPCTPQKSPLILIIVCSTLENAELRKSIRETWASDAKDYNVHVLFLVGKKMNSYLKDQVHEESTKYKDLILENFIDSYHNLTIKSIMMLKWVKNNCPNAQYTMKIDDDVYLNLNILVKFVKSDEVKSKNVLVGKLYTHEKPHRERISKWFIPESVYPRDYYPYYLCGVGYLASTDVALKLYKESFKHQLIFIEDVFLTGICAEKLGLKHKDHLGFRFFEHAVQVECNSIHPHMILLSHHVDAQEMRKIHSDILDCGMLT